MTRPAVTRVTAPYGESDDYLPGVFHNGLDFANRLPDDTPAREVYAFRAGIVTYVGWVAGFAGRGFVVIIDHGGGVVTWSCHLATALVKVGQHVAEGQHVATMGSSGTTVVHLHWMVYLNGQVVDPAPYLTSSAGGGFPPFPTPKDNEIMAHLWKYTSSRPEQFILIDHLNMTYRIIPAGSLEEGAIKNDIAAGVVRFDPIADPAWGKFFGNGQFRQITRPDSIVVGSGSGVSPDVVEEIVAASEARVIAKIPTRLA